jgi:cobalt-zinc-cadmium efflux system outer membrane protein
MLNWLIDFVLKKRLLTHRIFLLNLFLGSAVAHAAEELTLAQALALALEKNPELAAYSADLRAADGRRMQMAEIPNPEVSVELENVAGSGDLSGIRSAETTLQLSQLIELGGKRSQRVRVADHGRMVAGLDYDAKRLEVFRAVAQQFITVLSAQRRLQWAEDAVRLTEKFEPSARKRVEAGAASTVELTRFNLQIATAKIERDQIQRDLATARKRLAALWGNNDPVFERVVGELEKLPAVPLLDESDQQLAQTPALKRWESEQTRREAAIALERATAKPDVTVGAGYRHFNDSGESAAVFSLSVPLPLFNRNQGAVREAQAEADKAAAERHATEVRLRADLRVAFDNLATARTQIAAFKETILPQAHDAFAKVNDGYQAGRFTYLEVVDAQNTLMDAQVRYLEALTAYHLAVADIEGLTAQPLRQTLEKE